MHSMLFQTTLQFPVSCHGVALHSGAQTRMVLKPAPADHGIVFMRNDVPGDKAMVRARYDLVSDTRLGTTLTNEHGVSVMTVEHLMAALAGCGIDNCLIEITGPEVPIMDGSSEPFVFLLECAGVNELNVPRRQLEVLRTITVEEEGAKAMMQPADHFRLDITIQFEHLEIGTQQALYDFSQTSFKQALCRARTFGFASEVEQLRKIGLAQGGSLENAIVLSDECILNREGLRYRDEFVRHKALDCVGDYRLAGVIPHAHVITHRPGHRINNLLMRELFADPANYRWHLDGAAAPAAQPKKAARYAPSKEPLPQPVAV